MVSVNRVHFTHLGTGKGFSEISLPVMVTSDRLPTQKRFTRNSATAGISSATARTEAVLMSYQPLICIYASVGSRARSPPIMMGLPKSVRTLMAAMRAPPATPGRHRGQNTSRNTCHRVAPML